MEGSGSPPSEGERRKGAAGRAQEAGARASLRRRYPGPPWPSGRPQPAAGVGARGFVCGVPRALGRRGRGGRGTERGLAGPRAPGAHLLADPQILCPAGPAEAGCRSPPGRGLVNQGTIALVPTALPKDNMSAAC